MQNFKDGIFLGLYSVAFFAVYFFSLCFGNLPHYFWMVVFMSPLLLYIYLLSMLTSYSIDEFLSKSGGYILIRIICFIILSLCHIDHTNKHYLTIMVISGCSIISDICVHILALIFTIIRMLSKKSKRKKDVDL